MTYYLFENGDVSDANMVLGNFNELTYAILYNRMEQDAAGGTQIDQSIQSDQFCDADGRYNTVCTGGTTSVFNTNLYTNYLSSNEFPGSCLFCCCTFTCAASSAPYCNNTYTANCITQCMCHVCNPNGALGASNIMLNFCDSFDLNTIRGLTIFINGSSCFIQCDYSAVTKCSRTCLTIGGDTYSCTGNTSPLTLSYCKCYMYNGTNFDVCINGTCVCAIAPTTLNLLFCSDIIHSITGGTVTSVAYFRAWKIFAFCVLSYNTVVGNISTNIKNYATPKNTVILSTNALLPTGNYIKYDIKNQAGTVRLCDASPDVVYALNADTDCCFYAVIKQCVECNLCTPQCMFGYALKMM